MARYEFPLKWPEDWPREGGKEASKFNTPISKAHSKLSLQLQAMGGSAIIISTDVPLRADGVMRMDRSPVNPGCAVYFTRDGKQMTFACDRYDELRDNMTAIAKTIEAMRGIERWGASSMMERAFAGFGITKAAVVPPLPEEDWWKVFGVSRESDIEVVEAVYKTKARKAHPDNGGSTAEMQRLTRARDRAREEKRV